MTSVKHFPVLLMLTPLLCSGQGTQVASPAEIYERPNSRWVAGFIGEATMMEGRVGPDGNIESALGRMRTGGTGKTRPGDTVWLALRPEKIGMAADRPKDHFNAVSGTV